MSSAVMERTTFGSPTGATATPGFGKTAAPATNLCVVPRCELRFEKCAGGCKIHCKCDDAVAATTLQNLCRAPCEGQCSCCCTWNCIQICNLSLCCGHCKCETTADGCCISCTSGDK